MNLPVDVVVTGMESHSDLAQAVEAAVTFRPLSEEEVKSILERSAPFAENGKLEKYKTTQEFDATAHNPEWLESA
jgi:hypothetical protein